MALNNPMRVLLLEAYQSSLRLTQVERPTPGKGEVLVRIKTSGVNPLDLKIQAGEAAHARHSLPAILGIDLAGVVERVGPEVEQFIPGDEVYGMTGGVGGHQGSLAEYAAVDANLLAKKPANVTMRKAAAFPLIFITAWEGLVDWAKIQPGQKVLIHGGAGEVGHMAIQIAQAFGAQVFATGSTKQKDNIASFGATAIDYTTTATEEYLAAYTNGEGFDIVYDNVGGTTLDASFLAVRTYGGHVVSSLGWSTHKLAPLSFRSATYSGIFTLLPLLTGKGRDHHGAILREATQMAEVGKLRVLLDARSFQLEKIDDAHQALRERTASGKVVIELEN